MAETPKPTGNGGEAKPKAVFHYIKGQQFRVIHLDGVIGSVTPHMNIHMAMFNERPAIPQRMTYSVKADGALGEPVDSETVSRGGLVRELDVDVMMNLSVAEALYKWLGARIQELKAAMADSDARKGKTK